MWLWSKNKELQTVTLTPHSWVCYPISCCIKIAKLWFRNPCFDYDFSFYLWNNAKYIHLKKIKFIPSLQNIWCARYPSGTRESVTHYTDTSTRTNHFKLEQITFYQSLSNSLPPFPHNPPHPLLLYSCSCALHTFSLSRENKNQLRIQLRFP